MFLVYKGLFISRWAGPVRWAISSRRDLAFLKKLLQKYNAFIWEASQPEILPRRDENFPYEHEQGDNPRDRDFFNQLFFAF